MDIWTVFTFWLIQITVRSLEYKLVRTSVFISLESIVGGELLCHTVTQLHLWRSSQTVSKLAAPLYIPTRRLHF